VLRVFPINRHARLKITGREDLFVRLFVCLLVCLFVYMLYETVGLLFGHMREVISLRAGRPVEEIGNLRCFREFAQINHNDSVPPLP
jgi:hypothetical protein